MALLGDVGLQKCGVENGKFRVRPTESQFKKDRKFVLSLSGRYSGTTWYKLKRTPAACPT